MNETQRHFFFSCNPFVFVTGLISFSKMGFFGILEDLSIARSELCEEISSIKGNTSKKL